MPTYDYACKHCEHTFEVFQGIHDKLLRKCPECGRLGLERLFGTGAGIMFKGSGFYETDYRSDSYKKGAEADKKVSSPKDSKDNSKDKGASSGGSSAAKPKDSKAKKTKKKS